MKDSQITIEMIEELNRVLKQMGCSFKYKMIPGGCMERTMATDVFIHPEYNANIIVTDTFYDFLNEFFNSKYNIELSYNNTGSICWAKS